MKTRKKPTYTVDVHARRLKLMLKRKELSNNCPAAKEFDGKKSYDELWSDDTWPCDICAGFVGINAGANSNVKFPCPCLILNCARARERSEKALKRYYCD